MLSVILIGISLSMDAFAVSVTNGIAMRPFKTGYALWHGLYFGAFQFLMPLAGYILGSTVSGYVTAIGPYVSFVLLAFIGGKMIWDAVKELRAPEACPVGRAFSYKLMVVQAFATSIDALSVGFTISEYGWLMALAASLIIAVVTFFICMAGLRIGKKFGTKLSGKASILGGIILIGIGLEIFISGVF